MIDYKQQLEKLLFEITAKGASDLHLSPGHYALLRIDRRLVPDKSLGILDPETLDGLVTALLGEERKKMFLTEKELDFSFSLGDRARFRVNTYTTKGIPSATLRYIPSNIPTLEELNLPKMIKIFTKLSQGFVLIVGPNGHGKTTTIASLLDTINHERAVKMVTIEDPIEYLFVPDQSVIDQRELYSDTHSFHRALRSTFRQNVDIIMVGEMRDHETMSAAVSAAETGHLVFATLHTNDAAQTIHRIIDSFPPDQQSQIRAQLSSSLSGIISQRLISRISGGLIPAVEVLIANSAVRNLIRENRVQQINVVIDTSYEDGMISLDRSLADLVRNREISLEQAEFHSTDINELHTLLK